MAARDTILDFFSADSNGRGEPMDREASALEEVVRPPPIALSLRTRESSALALKHIFDQICSSAESTPDMSARAFEKKDTGEKFTVDNLSRYTAFQAARGYASLRPWQASSNNEESRMRPSEVDTSLARNQQAIPLMASPGSFFSNVNLPSYQAPLPQSISRPGSSSYSLQQPTAQLTIFYSGTVAVYDNVPTDKANAIMLLARSGSMKQIGEGEEERSTAKPSLLPANPQMNMSRSVTLPMAANARGTSAMTGGDKSMAFTTPFIQNLGLHSSSVTIASPPLLSPAPSVAAEFKQQAGLKRPHTGIELPHARKVSLARFLEKRKDRVLVKLPEAAQSEEKGLEDERPSKSVEAMQ